MVQWLESLPRLRPWWAVKLHDRIPAPCWVTTPQSCSQHVCGVSWVYFRVHNQFQSEHFTIPHMHPQFVDSVPLTRKIAPGLNGSEDL